MFKVKTKGFEIIEKKLANAPEKVTKLVKGVFENTAKEFVQRAKREAPKDTGFLTGEIDYRRTDDLTLQIFSSSRYAGFLEFGTKTFYTPIPGFEDQAAALKGAKYGSIDEMRDNIQQWVKRKGIMFTSNGKPIGEKQTAQLIMLSILRKGIKPQPYFFKQVAIAENNLEKDLKQIAEEIFD